MVLDKLEKIKKLRGILYRRIKSEEKDQPVSEFKFEKIKRFVELPEFKDAKTLNVIYPLTEPFAYANIKWEPEEKELVYFVMEPELNEKERKDFEKISEALIELVEVGFNAFKDTQKATEYLQKQMDKVLKDFGMKLNESQYVRIMYYIYRDFIGYNEIDGLMQDPNIEDISCDGTDTPVYVVHRKYGSVKTSVSFKDGEKLREFVIKLSERCGRYVSYAEPILDGTLPDGSRTSATLAGDVATRGPTFTIRKFGEKPMSPVEQMKLNTAASELLAYYWYLVEHGANMLFVGGTATGKTTMLNSICMFIPPERRVVSIEDTREIKIPHEHWLSGLSRTGFGIPMPTGEKYGEVTMFDLLRESFRQNPDYVVVGETRGKEAYVMFQGMASGHTSFSTFHANSVDAVVKRLTSPPIELSPILIESLNVISIMTQSKEGGKSKRRIKEVVEIISVDPRTEEVKTNLVFIWNPATDTFEKINDSQIIARLVESKGYKLEEVMEDIKRRAEVLDWLLAKDITDYMEVVKYVNMYYKEPDKLFATMGKAGEWKKEEVVEEAEMETRKEEVVVEGGRRRTSLLQLLGFKMTKHN